MQRFANAVFGLKTAAKARPLLPWMTLVVVTIAPAFGAIVTCPTVPATTSDSITPYVGAGNGCNTPDGTFENFSVGNASGQTIDSTTFGADAGTVSPGSNQIFATQAPGTAPDPNLLEIFSPGVGFYPGPFAGTDQSTNYCGAGTGPWGWCINGSNMSVTSQVTFNTVFNTAVSSFGFQGSVFASSDGSPTAELFLEVCPGATSFSTGCAGYTALEGGIVNGSATSLPILLYTGFSPTVDVASRLTIFDQTGNSGTAWASMGNFDMTTSAPEPGSFVLAGSALLALGLISFRRRF